MARDYTALITSEHRNAAKFNAMLNYITGEIGKISDLQLAFKSYYDLDTAIGHQLDVIGLWVGASRRVVVPTDTWFAWNVAGHGWNEGVWKSTFDPGTGLVDLSDNIFRRLLRCVIAANHWDGSLKQYQQVLQTFFTDGHVIWAQDNFDMTIDVHVTGAVLGPAVDALLRTGRISEIRPAGVAIANYFFP